MSIVLTRIDNRLIHGQVLEAWLPYTHADCIVVANDEVAGTVMQRLMMEAAVPRGIKVVIGTIEEVARLITGHRLDGFRLLVLFANSRDACRAHEAGVSFRKLNLGNMHASKDKVKLSCTIAIDRQDVEYLSRLEAEGVRIVSQCVPQDFEQSWHKLIRNWQDPYAE
ncbi:MAG: PTS sugar transporter subunit IIB [Desulfuromonadales bacterium]